jgi:gamma-glutamyltranspeptidase/glutathione hydrolase
MLGEVDLNPASRKAAVPGRRLTSMMAPSVLLWQGRPRLVVGSAGSERLRGAITQTIVNVVDHGMDLRDAIDTPRIHLDGTELHCEGGTDSDVLERLPALGYDVSGWPGEERNLYFGGVSAVAVGADGTLEAAGDPRRGGAGVVVQ